jgi:hypothetical protein
MRKLVGAFQPHAQQFLPAEDFFGFEKFIAIERVADRLLENLHIGQPRIAFERVNAPLKTRESAAKTFLIGVRDLDTGRWNEVKRTRRLLSDQNSATAERSKTKGPFHIESPL